MTGQPVQGLEDFFKSYAEEFKANGKLSRKRKAPAKSSGEKGEKEAKNGKEVKNSKKQKKNDGDSKKPAEKEEDLVLEDA